MYESGAMTVLSYLPYTIRSRLEQGILQEIPDVEEIRLRSNAPLTLGIRGENCFLTENGGITNYESHAYRVSQEEVQAAFLAICENSVYAHMDEIRQGFLTLKGGHRVGICGKAATEDGKIRMFREISSLNFRIAHQIPGAADCIMDSLIQGREVVSTLIVSPPQMGKTTLLRDAARQISDCGFKTGIADDRGEIAAMYGGVPQNDVGAQTDVLDNLPKAEAVQMLLRTMSPAVLITDEIACEADASAVRLAHGTGVAILASAHGSDLSEVLGRKVLQPLFSDGVFRQAILLRRDFRSAESVTYTKAVTL